MIVPNCHVQELITETQPDNWGQGDRRAWQDGTPSRSRRPAVGGRQSAVVIALGTIESTRIAATTLAAPAGRRPAHPAATW